MNIYARYFDQDTLVRNYDELMNFLSSIPEIPINQRLEDDVRAYVESDMPYPKRYKIRPRVYFILIKTSAETMEEFKAHRKGNNNTQERESIANERPTFVKDNGIINKKEIKVAQLAQERSGWYLGTITFKRVLPINGTTNSGNECYERIIEHLKKRTEIDVRSQFPSAKGSNFTFEFVGNELPTEQVEKA